MNSNLDHLVQAVHLQKDDCNIFLIGEIHEKWEKCDSIRIMFQNLVEYIELNYDSVKIDLMIEIAEYNVKQPIDNIIFNSEEWQIDQVRKLFMRCIADAKYTKDKNLCGNLNVHWLDPIISDEHDLYKFLPKWYKILERFLKKGNIPSFKIKKENPEMWNDFNPEKDENDIIKLLTENPIVMKEIDKAYKKDIFFERTNITKIFMDFYLKNKIDNKLQQNIFTMWRTLMDFYTIARIIKSDMKKVIIYTGNNHIIRIVYLLTEYLEFKKFDVKEGICV